MRTLICGAGIAGLALALRLADLGAEVTVVERAPGPRAQGYMIDFFGPGYDAAEAMGVLPRIKELGYAIKEMAYLDESGRRRAGLDFARFARMAEGRLVSVMRPDLERALREGVEGRVDLRFGRTITHIDNRPDGVRATLSDGTVFDAELLVGADGIHSSVRRAVFGPEERFLRYLGFHTAAFAFTDPEIHREVRDRFVLTDTTEREMGLYGLRDGRTAVFTVHRAADPALPADPRQALRTEYAPLGWLAPRVLAHCPDPSQVYYDQVAQIEMPEWSRDRVVLLGDACQAVSLLAGQGASLAVAAAYVLAHELAAGGTVADALARYQDRWHREATEKQQLARQGAEWFLPASRTRLRLRRLALNLARLPGLERHFAAGLVGKPSTAIQHLTSSPEPLGR